MLGFVYGYCRTNGVAQTCGVNLEAVEEAVVDITYAPRRFVRKRRGAPPGQVQVEREKVLVLRMDPARLAALLAREEAAP